MVLGGVLPLPFQSPESSPLSRCRIYSRLENCSPSYWSQPPLKQLQVPATSPRPGSFLFQGHQGPSAAREGCWAFTGGYPALHFSGDAAEGKQFPPFTLPKAQLQHPLRELYSKLQQAANFPTTQGTAQSPGSSVCLASKARTKKHKLDPPRTGL